MVATELIIWLTDYEHDENFYKNKHESTNQPPQHKDH
jgi:hypothetical protein